MLWIGQMRSAIEMADLSRQMSWGSLRPPAAGLRSDWVPCLRQSSTKEPGNSGVGSPCVHVISKSIARGYGSFSWTRLPIPWAEAACGVLWTQSDFPLIHTSEVNFTPQLSVGAHIFLRPRRSLDFAMNLVHISNGNTADENPGVNVITQFTLGYTWWSSGK